MNHQMPGRNDPCPCGSGKKYKKCCLEKDSKMSGNGNLMPNIQSYVLQAQQAFTSGLLTEAKEICQNILEVAPSNAEAIHILGLVEFSRNNLDIAEKFLQKAIDRAPKNPQIRCNYAKLLINSERVDAAIKQLREAIKLDPKYIDSFKTMGNVFLDQENYEQAKEYYSRALSIEPNNLESQSGYYFSLFNIGENEKAREGYINLLKTYGNYIPGYINLATIYRKEKEYEKAANEIGKALNIEPKNAELNNLMGSLQIQIGKEEEGVKYYQKSLEIEPNQINTYFNLLEHLRRKNQLEECYKYAQKIVNHSQYSKIYIDAFNIFGQVADFGAREALYETINNNINSPAVCKDIYRYLLSINYIDNIESQTIYRILRCYSTEIEKIKSPLWNKNTKRKNKNKENEKLRIGYLSGDFRIHPVGFFIKNILANSNYDKYEVYCYYLSGVNDELTEEIKHSVSKFKKVDEKDSREIAASIKDDNIDILVDLGGHTYQIICEILAYKPAPIQVSYLGYPNTTGLTTVDYRITDKYADTKDGTIYSENKIEMPDCFLSFGELENLLIEDKSAEEQSGYITFGSFNNIQKLNTPTIELWAEILSSVNGSKLFIKQTELEHSFIRDNMYKIFKEYGVDESQLILKGRVESKSDHLKYYNHIDIALDTFPYNGTTTTCEALWMGVPVVTLVGNEHRQRVSYSILKNIGIEQTIAYSKEEYLNIARGLAKDKLARKELRHSLRTRLKNSILCDTPRFTKQLEEKYLDMWQNYLGKKEA